MKLSGFIWVFLLAMFIAGCGGSDSVSFNPDTVVKETFSESNEQFLSAGIPKRYEAKYVLRGGSTTCNTGYITGLNSEGTLVGYFSCFVGAGGGSWGYHEFIYKNGEILESDLVRPQAIIGPDKVLDAYNGVYDVSEGTLTQVIAADKETFWNSQNAHGFTVGFVGESPAIALQNKGYVDLTLDDAHLVLNDINDNNIAIGRIEYPEGRFKFNGIMYRIPDLDSLVSVGSIDPQHYIAPEFDTPFIPRALNNLDYIVGHSRVKKGDKYYSHAFLYSPSIGVLDLQEISASKWLERDSEAKDVNNLGLVVGTIDEYEDSSIGFVANVEQGLVDLNQLVDLEGYIITSAQAVNDQGEIAVFAKKTELEPELYDNPFLVYVFILSPA